MTTALKYRVFISYSHEDFATVEKLVPMLEECGLQPLYDKHIRPGSAFTEAIKGLITHAHIFIPLITENSKGRPWVHQETGYAMAFNIPILPIAIMNQPGEMIAQLQSIIVTDINDLPPKISEVKFDNLVLPPLTRPLEIFSIARWKEERTQALAEHANRVTLLNYAGYVRQQAGMSSFSIPDIELDDPSWRIRDGSRPQSDYYHHLLREERRALERHAQVIGCDLLIDPEVETSGQTEESRIDRLETLCKFLNDMPDDRIRIVCSCRARDANITLVGDWFYAESRLRSDGQGWGQTLFNWHPPSVLQYQQEFDAYFTALFADTVPPGSSSRLLALETIRGVIVRLQQTIDNRPKSGRWGGT